MEIEKIEQLEELLKNYIKPGTQVISHQISRLTATGENYGSTMLALKIKTKTQEGNEEIIEAVAKIPPPSEFLQAMFNTKITFKYEIDFYKHFIPILRNFVTQQGINADDFFDYFPKFYGARLNLSGTDEVDNNAVLLLENLKTSGYECVNRTVGFDLETAMVIMGNLATFHAIPIAMKLLKPDLFESQIRSKFQAYSVFDLEEETRQMALKKWVALIADVDECKNLIDKVESALSRDMKYILAPKNCNKLGSIREPFATIIHTDAWVNNFMVKFVKGKPQNIKIVDFQLYEYGSPVRDVIFFIFSSCSNDVIKNDHKNLIDHYYKVFVEVLKKFGCYSEQFSPEAFKNEIDFVLQRLVFLQIIMMLEPIFGTKDNTKELSELGPQDFKEVRPVTQEYKKRAGIIVNTFASNNWI